MTSDMSSDMTADTVTRMRADLKTAMRERDQTAMRALRSALAAIANAEAPPTDGRVNYTVGLSQEVARLELTDTDIDCIIRDEISDRRDTVEQIIPHGRETEIDELLAEIVVLERYID